jgi:hypothetical protein
MPQRRRFATGPRSQAPRSDAVSNGGDVLPDVGVPSIIARRYRDIVAALVEDQSGADRLSQTRLQLVHRFAAASLLAEQIEAGLARGEEINITEHALVCGTLVRVARIIGVDRTTHDATPTLADYLRSQQVE